MRFKFRAKDRYGENEWVYATGIAPIHNLYQPNGECLLVYEVYYEELDNWAESIETVQVIEKTIGQYTGLKDTKGVEIYEGDIVELDDDIAVVEWNSQYASFVANYIKYRHFDCMILGEVIDEGVKVIGNIHDNPELLKSTNNRKINQQITEK